METSRPEALPPAEQALLEQAFAARPLAYAPYSGQAVGAALLGTDGRVFLGCNQENAAFAPSLCAERAAFSQAVMAGCRDFSAIAVVGGPAGLPDSLPRAFWPCGLCRQVMAEFCGPSFRIIVAQSRENYQVSTLGCLLPQAFGPASLAQG